MTEMEGSDKMWSWTAMDFADNELVQEVFLIKFKDHDTGMGFVRAWNEARELNKAADGAAGGAGGASGGSSAAAAVEDAVPVATDLSAIYSGNALLEATRARYAALQAAFEKRYGRAPTAIVRAPGRVNLIGEHIDYHNYPVLPMALEQDIVIAVAAGDEISEGELATAKVTVANANPVWPEGEVPADPAASVDHEAGVSWFKYFQCGYKGGFEAAGEGAAPKPRKLEVMIDGNVPPSAGVSSSSALVVASVLATATAHGLTLSRQTLAETAIRTERHIGTMSGGMDQTISVFAENGSARLIEFNPINVHEVPLPEGGVFIVANSLVEASKAVDPTAYYNLRVTEGKFASKLVGKKAGCDGWEKFGTILDLQNGLGLASPAELQEHLERHLKAGAYTKAELLTEFGVPLESLFEGDPKREGALRVLGSQDAFACLQRARHVATESGRVQQFMMAALSGGDVATLGELMNASQDSCRDDYECSDPALDTVCTIAREAGASGARLTGAGWGGCAVILSESDKVEAVTKALKERYFDTKTDVLESRGLDLGKVLFQSKASAGAAIVRL